MVLCETPVGEADGTLAGVKMAPEHMSWAHVKVGGRLSRAAEFAAEFIYNLDQFTGQTSTDFGDDV